MVEKIYDTQEGKIKITEVEIKDHYCNGFAQTVYELENGVKLFISYHCDELRVEEKID